MKSTTISAMKFSYFGNIIKGKILHSFKIVIVTENREIQVYDSAH